MSQENKMTDNAQKEPFGELIRDARQNKKLSIKDLASDLNLSPSIIENLETENFSDLPPPMFVRGYIRAVSQYLGLNTDELLTIYNQHGFSDPSLIRNALPDSKKSINLNLRPVFKLVKWLLILAGVLGALWFGFTKWQETQKESTETDVLLLSNTLQNDEQIPLVVSNISTNDVSVSLPAQKPKPENSVMSSNSSLEIPPNAPIVSVTDDSRASSTQSNQSASSEPTQAAYADNATENTTHSDDKNSVLDASAAQAVERKKGVLIKTLEDAWVRVVDSNDKVLLSRLLKRNQERNIVGKPPYSLSIGNARAVKIEYNGEDFDHTQFINSRNVAKFKLN